MHDFAGLNKKYVVKYYLYKKKWGQYMQFINIGYGNIISANRIISIITPGAAPIKRMIQEAKEKSLVIDATSRKKNTCNNNYGYRAYSVISSTTWNSSR